MKYVIISFIFLTLFFMPDPYWQNLLKSSSSNETIEEAIIRIFTSMGGYSQGGTWAGLNKNSNDSETIEEAIDRLIAVHEEAPTSHLGAGESIEQHKNAEVIDHPAYSVLNDKVAFDGNTIDITFNNLDIFDHSTGVEIQGEETLLLTTSGLNNTQWCGGSVGDLSAGAEYDFPRNPRFLSKFMLSSISSQVGYFIVGELDEGRGFGLKILNNKLYGVYFKADYSEVTLELLTLVAYTVYKFDIRVDYPDSIKFYVNGGLVGTITSPDVPASMSFILQTPWIQIKGTSASAREMYVRGFHWEAEYP